MTIARMQVDGRYAPLEVDEPTPRFSWAVTAGEGWSKVIVSVFEEDAARPLWQAAVSWDEIAVVYDGPALRPATRYRWRVSLMHPTAPEHADAYFGTGLQGSWDAEWISRPAAPWFDERGEPADTRPASTVPRTWRTTYVAAPQQLRRRFVLDEVPVRATLFVTARGVYRAAVNGERAGRDELAPGWTDYRARIEYQAFDVTASVRAGENVLAADLADGWWSGYVGYNTRSHADQYGTRPQLLAQLVIDLPDGTRTTVSTDAEWRELSGSRVVADLLMGEYSDAALETAGWKDPGFDDSGWRAVETEPRDGVEIVGQRADGIRVVAELAPVSIDRRETSFVVDFGQNVSGRVRLHVRGARAGDVVRIRHGERLDDGALYTANLRTAEATDVLVAGDGDQVFEPIFTFHGFQYAEIEGLRGELSADDVRALAISSVDEREGSIRTSSALVQRIDANAWWGQRGNFVSVPTDCPQRDERLGWTADTQVFAGTASFNADVHAFLHRWLRELNSAQEPSGRVADVVPVPPTSAMFDVGAPGWGDAAVIVPWTLYRMYGDRDLLAEQLAHMRAWVDYVHDVNEGMLWTRHLGNNYGDWLSVDADTPRAVVAGAYQIRSVSLVAEACAVLGDAGAARTYAREAARLRGLFVDAFVDSEGRVHGDTQTGYLFALAWDLIPDDRRDQVSAHLIADVERRRHLTTGFLGVGLLCPTLTDLGRADLAVDLLLRESYPSWGYSIAHGATTMWERWDGWTEHSGFQSIAMNSFNHYSFGSVVEWLYRGVGGIDQEHASSGFQRIVFSPAFDERLPEFAATYASVRGEIRSAWDLREGWFEVTVPPTSTARVLLGDSEQRVGPGVHRFTLTSATAPVAPRRELLARP